ncbi:MAG: hypothetical protein M3R24_41620 [Chloroflexota bacterium]|nr:hypothetical protein [Chloroflexota bacterium]
MADKPLPWPYVAERYRKQSIQAAVDATELVEAVMPTVPDRDGQFKLLYTLRLLSDIRRWLIEAKAGLAPDERGEERAA